MSLATGGSRSLRRTPSGSLPPSTFNAQTSSRRGHDSFDNLLDGAAGQRLLDANDGHHQWTALPAGRQRRQAICFAVGPNDLCLVALAGDFTPPTLDASSITLAVKASHLARTGRAAAEKQLEGARGKLAETERQHQAKALEFVTSNTRISAELEAAKTGVKNLTAAVDDQAQQLQNSQQQASQFKAEADTLRSLVAQFKPASLVKTARAKRSIP